MGKIYLVPPPAFKGRNERYITNHLKRNLKGGVILLDPMVESSENPGEGFYHTETWVRHQMKMVQKIIDIPAYEEDDHIVFTDFWFPGLEMVQMALNARKGPRPCLVGYLHGASFVDGDLVQDNWIPPLETCWMEIYDHIWAASMFFVKNMPRAYVGKVQIVGEPFLPNELQSYRNTTSKKTYDIVYPHRLAPDKGFDEFCHLVKRLLQWSTRPTILVTSAYPPSEQYLKRLQPAIDQGLVVVKSGTNDQEHLADLAQARVVLSTAIQEGWGYAVLKAISVGCIPVLPHRAVYPELYERQYLYKDLGEAESLLRVFIAGYPNGAFIPRKTIVGGRLKNGILTR